MSKASFEIALPPETLALIRALEPSRMLAAVARGLDRATELALARIKEERLRGQGPFPADEGRLGVRSARLVQSATRFPAQISGTTVTSSLGSNVRYAGIHEFGGTIRRVVKPGKVRLRTDRKGELLKRGNLATFARKSHKGVREISYAGGKEYTIAIPARAPFGHGLADSGEDFEREIGAALLAELERGTPA